MQSGIQKGRSGLCRKAQISHHFQKWLPEYETEFSTKAISPFHLVKSKEPCWKCGVISEVITFAAEGTVEDGEENIGFVIFSYVSLVPKKLAGFVEENFKNYFIDYSNTTKSFYYINHCHRCSASLGDFYMHSEPEGAFFPMTVDEAKDIELIELKGSGYIQLNADLTYQCPSTIEEHARRLKYRP